MNIWFFWLNPGTDFAALLRFSAFPATADELSIRDDSGGGGDCGDVGSGGGREARAVGTIFSDFVVGIVDALVVAGAAGVAVEA